MKRLNDLLLMSMTAFNKGQYRVSAKLYVEAMASDKEDISDFMDSLKIESSDSNVDLTSVSSSSNDLSDAEIIEIVATASDEFEKSNLLQDEDDETIESKASLDADDELDDTLESMSSVKTSGPVKFKI